MSNINILRNIVVDKEKVRSLVQDQTVDELADLCGVGKSQAYNIRRGYRMPATDGLLRLMMLHGLKPEDVVTLAMQK